MKGGEEREAIKEVRGVIRESEKDKMKLVKSM